MKLKNNMKTIEDAALEYAIQRHVDAEELKYIGRYQQSFKAGAEFAQRWVSVEEELPDSKNGYINKEVIAFTSDKFSYILIYDDYLGWLPNGTDADIDNITHWRPLNLK